MPDLSEVVEKFPNLRPEILSKLLAAFPDLKLAKIMRGALWVLGEYSLDQADIEAAMQAIRLVVGEVPILAAEQVRWEGAGGPGACPRAWLTRTPAGATTGVCARHACGSQRELERLAEEAAREGQSANPSTGAAPAAVPVTRVTVLADGTYSTQTTYTTDASTIAKATATKAPRPPQRGKGRQFTLPCTGAVWPQAG